MNYLIISGKQRIPIQTQVFFDHFVERSFRRLMPDAKAVNVFPLIEAQAQLKSLFKPPVPAGQGFGREQFDRAGLKTG